MPSARKRRALFVCGSLNQTKQLHRVASQLRDIECAFSPFFSTRLVEIARRLGLCENSIGGNKLRARCVAYLKEHGLQIDVDGKQSGYDLLVDCTDLTLPPQFRHTPTLIVQEGMTDPETWLSRLVQRTGAPLWISGTTLTGTSGAYAAMCVASEGYRELFIQRGAPADKLHVTGIPNFDDCASYRHNSLRDSGYVLACTSDLRELYRWDDRAGFLKRVRAAASGRAVHVKLHPNEHVRRARREIERHCPGAVIHTDTSAEELIANCSVLFTQYSSVAFVGLALGKEVHSYYPIEELKRLLPIQNGGRSAQAIAGVARELLGLPVAERARVEGACA
jgi:hypothetical protein